MKLITEILGTITEPDTLTIGNTMIFTGIIGSSPYFSTDSNKFFIQDFSKVDNYETITSFFHLGLNKNNKTIKEFIVNYD